MEELKIIFSIIGICLGGCFFLVLYFLGFKNIFVSVVNLYAIIFNVPLLANSRKIERAITDQERGLLVKMALYQIVLAAPAVIAFLLIVICDFNSISTFVGMLILSVDILLRYWILQKKTNKKINRTENTSVQK